MQRNTLVLLVAGLATACGASRSPRDFGEPTPSSAIGQRAGAYAIVQTPEALEEVIAEDLEAGRPAAVFDGLQAFIGENDRHRTMTGAHLVWAQVRPVAMLQYGGGRSQMTAVRQLGQVLESDAAKERQAAIEAVRQGHLGQLARLSERPLSPLHPNTGAMSPELEPYCKLTGALLAYRDLATSPNPDAADLERTLNALQEAEVAVSQRGDAQAAFLAQVAGAQSLERSGQIDAAAEFWFRAANHPDFAKQPPLVRDLVAARIDAYTTRVKESLVLEVEEERRAELRAQAESYAASAAELEQRFEGFDDWARSGFAAIEDRVRTATSEGEERDTALVAELERAKAYSAARAEDVALRISSLEDHMGDLSRRIAAGEDQDGELAADVAELRATLRGYRTELEALDTRTGKAEWRAAGAERTAADALSAAEGAAGDAAEALASAGRADSTARGAEGIARGADDVARAAEDTAKDAQEAARAAEEMARGAVDTARSAEDVARSADEAARSAQDAARSAQDTARAAEEVVARAADESAARAAATETAAAETAPVVPARFAIDAFPDVLAFLDGAKDADSSDRLSAFIVPMR